MSALAGQPVHYVANAGQWPESVRYRARLRAGSVLLQDRGWTLVHVGADNGAAVRMRLVGAAPAPLIPEGVREARYHYFVGRDPAQWRTGVPLYESVRYQRPYPNVDVRARAVDGVFEYDLLLAPGADLAAVQMVIEGASSVRPDGRGGLVIETPIGTLTQQPPVTWQTSIDGETRPLISRCVLLGGDRFGFEVDGWDRQSTLTVDPGLLWSTFFGGSGGGQPWDDVARAVSVDENGIVTIAGSTLSSNLPTTPGAFNANFVGGTNDAFVAQFDPSKVGAAQLLYTTYFGGTEAETIDGLHVAADGVVTVVGSTTSATTFPVVAGAFDSTYNGGGDCFVSRLDPRASGIAQLTYSTLLGGDQNDQVSNLSVDSAGVVTIAGYTASADFPTVLPYDATFRGGSYDMFVSRLDPSATGAAQLVYSTYLGTPGIDAATNLAVDSSGVITVVGSTTDASFPTTPGAFSSTLLGTKDAVVSQLDPRLTGPAQLIFSTLLGGDSGEQANAVALGASGVVTVTGITGDSSFPTTPNAYDRTFNGGTWDAFISQLDPAATGSAQLLYSTLIGGATGDFGLGVLVDSRGTVTITGEIGGFQSDYPTTPGAFDRSFAGGGGDAYVTRIDPNRVGVSQLIYSTFIGSSEYDRGLALSRAPLGVVVAGMTKSTGFPTTTGAYSSVHNGGSFDAFVSHLDMLPTGVFAFGASSPGCDGRLTMSVTSMPAAGNSAFTMLCDDAPKNSSTGFAILATSAMTIPTPLFGVDVWVHLAGPTVVLPAASDARGASDVALPIPAMPSIVGATLFAQFLWIGPNAPSPCPIFGLSASNGLGITIQP